MATHLIFHEVDDVEHWLHSPRRQEAFGRAACRRPTQERPADIALAVLAVAWFAGTWVPFELQSALDARTSFFYYMIVVMPGIYLALTHVGSLLWRARRTWLRGLVAAWGLAVLAAVVVMFPFVAIL